MYSVKTNLPTGDSFVTVSRDLDGALDLVGTSMVAIESDGFRFFSDEIHPLQHKGVYTYKRGSEVSTIEVFRS